MPRTPTVRRRRRTALTGAATVLALAVAAPLTTVTTTAAAEPGDVAYAQDFDAVADGELPEGWNAVAGDWAVQDGRLVAQPASIGRITFGPHLDNYRLEATVRFEAVNNPSRWLAPILDIDPSGGVPWWQAAMRSTTTASNGIEIAERTAGNAWNVPSTAAAPSDAGVGDDVRIAIEVQGAHATWIFDSTEVLEGRIGRSDDGVLGFSYDGARISIDDVVVTEIEPRSPVLDDGELPQVAAHRGYSAVAPENTLAAYAAAMRTGAEWVEIDVHTTADGVPIVLHDQRVDRTTDGTGDVAALASDDFTSLEAGSWFSPAYRWQPAPTFAQMLDLMETGPSGMLLEIKGPETRAEVHRVVDMIVDAGLDDRVVVQSFDANALRYARERAPQIPIGLLGNLSADPVATAAELGLDYYNPPAADALARPSTVADLNAAGVGVFAWTANSAGQWRELTDVGVDGIITDRAGELAGWKTAQGQVVAPEPATPTVRVVAPADGAAVERGDTVVVAATATDADEVSLTLDGDPVDNGTSVAATDLALGEHSVVATVAGEGGEATATSTFAVVVTAAGLRSRIAGLDVSTGQLRQLLSALDAEDWERLTATITKHVPDGAARDTLLAEVGEIAAVGG
ncbi:Ig-like domain-containing protein [Isoptericola sp. S6320L]|uniref:glycerophosphodiester phosphodiesterase family protein n=1 Tax=Isoptericola sp. S6320L TaxID=2926411 RepID=UPI001FF54382|nr:glycerophosphodiester phosphodiesterase family protein [Isoptericola sp. S6320L]MCK0118546.1 Ig-like domain-containing protein [Isoptericola sp. S6320L]